MTVLLIMLLGATGCGTKRATTITEPARREGKTPGLDLVEENCRGPRAIDIGHLLIDLHHDILGLQAEVGKAKDKADIKDEKAEQEIRDWKMYTVISGCVGIAIGLLTGVLAF